MVFDGKQRKAVRELTDVELREVQFAFYMLQHSPMKWLAPHDGDTKEQEEAKKKDRDDLLQFRRDYVGDAAPEEKSDSSSLFHELAYIHKTSCPHKEKAFLFWHRRYLLVFERLLQRAYRAGLTNGEGELIWPDDDTRDALGGNPDNITLPYWNYVAVGVADESEIPAAFDAGEVDFGIRAGVAVAVENPLACAKRVQSRGPNASGRALLHSWLERATDDTTGARAEWPGWDGRNADGELVDVESIDAGRMQDQIFESMVQSTFMVDGAGNNYTGFSSVLERKPHDYMHGLAGGPGGLLGWPPSAAFDPLFWFHHCNIDRLWWVWSRMHKDDLELLLTESDYFTDVYLANPSGERSLSNMYQPSVDLEFSVDSDALEAEATQTEVWRYSDQSAVEPAWQTFPTYRGHRFQMVVPQYADITGSYGVSVLMYRSDEDDYVKQSYPKTVAELTPEVAENHLIDVFFTFSDDQCPCSLHKRRHKNKAPFTDDVSRSVHHLLRKWGVDLPASALRAGELPDSLRFVTVAMPLAKPSDAVAEAPVTPARVSLAQGETTLLAVRVRVDDGRALVRRWLAFRTSAAEARILEKSSGDALESLGRAGASLADLAELPPEWSRGSMHHAFGSAGAGLRIALLDTGINVRKTKELQAADSAGRIKWRDFTDLRSPEPVDSIGHGTANAALLVGTEHGIVPDATLFVARVFGKRSAGNMQSVAAAVRWARQNRVHVICMPLAGRQEHSGVYREIMSALADGIEVVAATGSEHSASGHMLFPATIPGVVGVACPVDNRLFNSEAPTPKSVPLLNRAKQQVFIGLVAPGVHIPLPHIGALSESHATGSSLSATLAAGVVGLAIAVVNAGALEFGDRDRRLAATHMELMALFGVDVGVTMYPKDKRVLPNKVAKNCSRLLGEAAAGISGSASAAAPTAAASSAAPAPEAPTPALAMG